VLSIKKTRAAHFLSGQMALKWSSIFKATLDVPLSKERDASQQMVSYF
jgi:hypothetical protein